MIKGGLWWLIRRGVRVLVGQKVKSVILSKGCDGIWLIEVFWVGFLLKWDKVKSVISGLYKEVLWVRVGVWLLNCCFLRIAVVFRFY